MNNNLNWTNILDIYVERLFYFLSLVLMGKESKESKESKKDKDMTKAKETKAKESKANKAIPIKPTASSEVTQDASSLVVLEEIYSDAGGKEQLIYVLKLADIDIRIYLSYIDASVDANYLRGIVRKIITDKAGKVEIVELKTGRTYYLLRIAGFDIKPYLAIEEASRVAKYMEIVVGKILETA